MKLQIYHKVDIFLRGRLFVDTAGIIKVIMHAVWCIIKKSVMKCPIKHTFGNIIDDENEWGSYIICELLSDVTLHGGRFSSSLNRSSSLVFAG